MYVRAYNLRELRRCHAVEIRTDSCSAGCLRYILLRASFCFLRASSELHAKVLGQVPRQAYIPALPSQQINVYFLLPCWPPCVSTVCSGGLCLPVSSICLPVHGSDKVLSVFDGALQKAAVSSLTERTTTLIEQGLIEASKRRVCLPLLPCHAMPCPHQSLRC